MERLAFYGWSTEREKNNNIENNNSKKSRLRILCRYIPIRFTYDAPGKLIKRHHKTDNTQSNLVLSSIRRCILHRCILH